MRPDVLANAIEADIAAGRRPLFVVASAGTTSTGAVDPFVELAAIAKQHGAWLHVDGAYGAFAVLTERGAEALAGLELADSVTLDPHKWLYQPFECGCLLVRDGSVLDEAFVITPDYLTEAAARRGGELLRSRVPATRAARALKLWVSLNYFGLEAFRAAIDRSLDLALTVQRRVQESDELELMLPTSLGVTCFRRRFGGIDDEEELARLNAQLVSGLQASGKGVISSTRLRGRFALRMCVLNHTTTEADVEAVLSWLERAEVAPAAAIETVDAAMRDRHPDAASARLERDRVEPSMLAGAAAVRVAERRPARARGRSARMIAAEPGEAIVRKWESARDFFVLADGTVDVHGDGEHYGDLGPGDFFGELAALEWGAGFGYPRLATVDRDVAGEGRRAVQRHIQCTDARSSRPRQAGSQRHARAPAGFLARHSASAARPRCAERAPRRALVRERGVCGGVAGHAVHRAARERGACPGTGRAAACGTATATGPGGRSPGRAGSVPPPTSPPTRLRLRRLELGRAEHVAGEDPVAERRARKRSTCASMRSTWRSSSAAQSTPRCGPCVYAHAVCLPSGARVGSATVCWPSSRNGRSGSRARGCASVSSSSSSPPPTCTVPAPRTCSAATGSDRRAPSRPSPSRGP